MVNPTNNHIHRAETGATGKPPAKARPETETPVEPQDSAQVGQPTHGKERLIGAVVRVDPDRIGLKRVDDAGNEESSSMLAFIPEERQAEFEKMGAVVPEYVAVRSDLNMPEGSSIEPVALEAPANPANTTIARTMEVPKAMLMQDPDTGRAPIEDFHARLVPNDGQVMFKEDIERLRPKTHDLKLADSAAGEAIEKRRNMLNGVSTFANLITQTSLLGFWNIPGAPLIAVGTSGFTINKTMETLKGLEDQKDYVRRQRKESDGDIVQLRVNDQFSRPVSAKEETKRLSSQILQTKAQLASNGLLLGAGASSILGLMANGGALGTGTMATVLAGATAWTPWLAGASLAMGYGANVMTTVKELKDLAAEKKELQAALARGETTVKHTHEVIHPQLKQQVAIKEVDMPIDKRLEEISKAQKKNVSMLALIGGGVGSAAATFGFAAPMALALPISLGPAGAIVGFNAIGDMVKLNGEKKELKALQESGQTTVKQQIQMPEGEWVEKEVPIEQRLDQLQRQINGKKILLSAVGSGVAFAGMTAGLGMGMLAAAPVVLVPGIVAAALFPKETKAIVQGIWKFITNIFGKEARSRKATLSEVKGQAKAFVEKMSEQEKALKQANPDAYAKLKEAFGSYATSTDPGARAAQIEEIGKALNSLKTGAPDATRAWLTSFRELDKSVEGEWRKHQVVAHMVSDVAKNVLGNETLRTRLDEVGFQGDMRDRYEDFVTHQLDPGQTHQRELLGKAAKGDQSAGKELTIDGQFGAAQAVETAREMFGAELLDSMIEAVMKSENGQLSKEQLDGFAKVASEKLGQEIPGQGLQALAQGIGVLEGKIPLDFSGVSAQPQELPKLNAHEQAMAEAFGKMMEADPEAGAKLNQALLTLSGQFEHEPKDQAEAAKMFQQATQNLSGAIATFEQKAPEALAAWQDARSKQMEAFLDANFDKSAFEQLLNSSQVQAALKDTGTSAEEAQVLFKKLGKANLTQDFSELAPIQQATDPASAEGKAKKVLEAFERAGLEHVAKEAGGTPAAEGPTQEQVQGYINQVFSSNPTIAETLQSPELEAVAKEHGVEPEFARQSFVRLLASDVDPRLSADLKARLEANDAEAAKEMAVSTAVLELVQSKSKAADEARLASIDPGQLKAAENEIFASDMMKTALELPEFGQLQQHLQADSNTVEEAARILIRAQLTQSGSEIQALNEAANKGDTEALKKLQLLQGVQQATAAVQQAAAQQQQPPAAPPAPAAEAPAETVEAKQ
ncbi:MAG: hypothetical protein AB7S38_00925 [Vulcanimicrobiota bacterium]